MQRMRSIAGRPDLKCRRMYRGVKSGRMKPSLKNKNLVGFARGVPERVYNGGGTSKETRIGSGGVSFVFL